MAITTLNNRAINRSDTAASGQLWTATSAVASDFQAAAAGGKVGQVLTAQITGQVDISSSSAVYADITGLTVDITPAATSSKILVMATVNLGYNVGTIACQLMRDSTPIGIGDASGSRGRATFGTRTAGDAYGLDVLNMKESWLDSPSTTSAVTYKVQTHASGYTETIRINSSNDDGDAVYALRTVSTITVMEILA